MSPVLASLAAVLLALPAQGSSPLPTVAIESLPPAARQSVSRVYREAVAHPGDIERVGALARTLHAWELWDAAHQTYARVQQLDPQSFEWLYLDGVVLHRLARYADAAQRFERASAMNPSYLPARVKLAEALLDGGDATRSEPLFQALVKEPAAEPAAEVGLGRIAAARGNHQEAIVHFSRAVKLFPELGAAHYALAQSYRTLGRRDDAQRELALHAKYGARWPAMQDDVLERVVALKEDAGTLIERGMRAAEEGDLAAAVAAHEDALAKDPSSVDARANLISLYGRERNWQKAEEHYTALVAAGANLGDAHYDYGVLLGLQERWPEAAEAYRRAVAVNPQHAPARNNLGQVLERERKFEEAAQEYRQALEAQPGFRLARFNLGRMLIALNRPGDAIVELQKIVEPRDAESPRYWFGLSVAHVRAGHKDEGIKWATEARRLALEFGQQDLAASIERNLASLR
jgi:tetratricopeptide (TPR) repeat protein